MSQISTRNVLVIALALVALAAPTAAGVAVADSHDDSPPDVPAAYYGSATVNGEPISTGTEIEAVVNGEVADTITVSQEGSFGGPDAFDEKLVVKDASSGDTVAFRVRGASAEESVKWESGAVQEVDLSFTGVPVDDTDEEIDRGDAEVVLEVAAPIETDPATGNPTVSLETEDPESPVSEIEFSPDSDELSGGVNVVELDTEPAGTGPAPGDSVSVTQIQVPETAADNSATIRMSVSNDRLSEIDANPEDLRANRFVNGEWQTLETNVAEQTESEVVLEAETPGFSYFAVSAVSEPVADLSIDPETVEAGSDISLDASGSTTEHGEIVSYEWSVADETLTGETATTTIDETGEYDVELTVTNDAGETDTASSTLVVESESDGGEDDDGSDGDEGGDGDDDAGGGGGGGGAAPSDDEDQEDDVPESVPDDVAVEAVETVATQVDEEAAETVATPEETSVEEIRIESDQVDGEVTVADLESEPGETGPSPGASVSVVQITVPDEATDTPGTVRTSVSQSTLNDVDAVAEDLRVNRYAEGDWQPLDTEVVERTDDGVVLEAETPGFSYFSVSAVSEPTASIEASATTVETGEDVELDASGSDDRYGEVVSYEWSIADESLSGETVSTTIDEPGEYDVELTVTNDAGETDTVTTSITVNAVDTSEMTDQPPDDSEEPPETTEEWIPGFTGMMAVLTLIGSALIAGRYAG